MPTDNAPKRLSTIVDEGLHRCRLSLRTSNELGREPKLRRNGSGRLPLRRRNGVGRIVQKRPRSKRTERSPRASSIRLPDSSADERAQAGDVAARTRQRGDDADAQRLPDGGHDDGDGRGGGFRGHAPPAFRGSRSGRRGWRTSSATSSGKRSPWPRPSGSRCARFCALHVSELMQPVDATPQSVAWFCARGTRLQDADERSTFACARAASGHAAAAPPSSVMNSRVAVGTCVSWHAPRPESVRAAFPHTAPASGV